MMKSDPAPHIEAVLAAQREADQPGATFRAVDAALAATTGHILFTILIQHPRLRESERFYSNMPDAYPVGGRKPMTDSRYMRRLAEEGQPVIGRNEADIRDMFFDHALILSLGCEGVMNMPVRWKGATLGTVNLLHRAGWYGEDDIPNVRLFAQLALPAMMLISQH
jgi:hypothetical protein